MLQKPRSRIVPLVVGTAVSTGLGMIPLHRLPHTVRTGYVVLPAAFVAGVVLVAMRRRDVEATDDVEATNTGAATLPRPWIPTVSEGAIALALGGLVAGAGAASIGVDRGIENLLRRRGVSAPRLWMGVASGALTLAMAALESPDREQPEELTSPPSAR